MKDYLINHAEKKKTSFHMPGHKGANIYRTCGYEDFLQLIMDCDITEIQGADNLYNPLGIIKETQEKYEKLYDVKKTFLLVNGTTAGILASIMATVPRGKKLLMSRGCHKSVYNGLKLAGGKPVYIQPQFIKEAGIMGPIKPEDVEKALKKDKDIEAIILPSPNYYGICSDIKGIADIAHKYGKILIVDQAHGAHLKFFHKFGVGEGMPMAAEDCDADIVINSTHKTLASFTQSAILNVVSDRVDADEIFEKIQLIQSTSPSYILMGSLDINAEIIIHYGKEFFKRWRKDIDWFYEEASKIEGLIIVQCQGLDKTKINMNLGRWGIDGSTFEEFLLSKKIVCELVSGDIVMAMTGIGNVRFDYTYLYHCILECIDILGKTKLKEPINKEEYIRQYRGFSIPEPGIPQKHGIEKEEIKLEEGVGRICAANITPYPPGIPFACSGEEITEEMVYDLIELRRQNKSICGVSEEGYIHVFKK